MNFSDYFIKRPILAGVLSIVVFLVGLISMWRLPISEYPEVVPPTVIVRATYPGANPKTISETVAAPLEQAINGVEHSLYMFSQATSDGVMTLTITFAIGTDLDNAQVQVQNRVSQVLPKLPEEVRRIGVVTQKASPDLLMVVHLFSPDNRYDDIYVRNYATLQVRDVLARLNGVGDVRVFGSGDYAMRVWLDPNKVAAKGLTTSDAVRATMKELVKTFPEGLSYDIVYDPTVFVRSSIEAVVHTLFEAILLVVLVVILFLQTWRASIIPLAAVPVSLVGTFAVMHALGFSINALSLFGLVLAIGIVVDDAIVVVENVERNISLGKSPLEATKQAMREVTGPIVATALVLAAVFVPTAFITGLTGQFYKQFAITIAISTVISAFNSLTLSPALSALLLKDHHAPKDALARGMDWAFGWFFRPFNRFFDWAAHKYSNGVARLLRLSGIALIVYVGLLAFTGFSFTKIPTGFVPTQDKQYLVAFAQLPDASSLDRTDAVIRKMGEIALKHPGVANSIAFPGLSINGFTNSPSSGIVFVALKDFEERKGKGMSGQEIAQQLQAEYAQIQDAFVAIFPPPPVMGLGTIGGFKLYVEDRGDNGLDALYGATQALIAKANQTPGLAGVFSGFTINTPQLEATVDRAKAKAQGIPLQNVFETMQINLGSLYVNDFNRFGRTYQVVAQADAKFRAHAEDITRLKTRNDKGELVPLGTIVAVKDAYGPDRVVHYNGYPSAEINGAPAPGFSSGQAEAIMQKLAAETLPKGMTLEWTELTFQKIIAGNAGLWVYPLSILLVFLVLAAQYESFRLPFAVILVVPMALFSALIGRTNTSTARPS